MATTQAGNNYAPIIASAQGDIARSTEGFDATVAERDAKEEAIRAGGQARMGELESQRAAAAGEVKNLQDAGPKHEPLPTNTAQHIDPKQLNETASMMMALAGLAGLLTRRPMVAALSNMTAAMKGLQAGDEQQYQRSYKEFSDNYKRAVDQTTTNVKEYERILKSREMTLSEKSRAITAYAKQVGDEITANQLSFKQRIEHFEKLRKAAEQAEKNALTLSERHDKGVADRQQRKEIADNNLEQRRQHDETVAALKASAAAGGGGGRKGSILSQLDEISSSTLPEDQKLAATRKILGIKSGESSLNARFGARQVGAMNEISAHLGNIAALPMGANMGTFSDVAHRNSDTFFKALGSKAAQLITPEEARIFDQEAASIEAAMFQVNNMGQSGGGAARIKELKETRPRANDPKSAMASYLALARQSVEMSNREIKIWPGHTPEMEALAAVLVDEVKQAIPWTVADVNRAVLQRTGGPTLADGMPASTGMTPAQSAPKPTDRDRELARQSPARAEAFKRHFKVDP